MTGNPEAENALTRLLEQVYASQQTYGDKAQMMGYRDQMFQLVLGGYTFRKVRDAFIQHVRTSPNLPTPSCIVKIIDPPPEPMSAAVYTELRRRNREGEYLTRHEREYCERFETMHVMGGGHEAE